MSNVVHIPIVPRLRPAVTQDEWDKAKLQRIADIRTKMMHLARELVDLSDSNELEITINAMREFYLESDAS